MSTLRGTKRRITDYMQSAGAGGAPAGAYYPKGMRAARRRGTGRYATDPHSGKYTVRGTRSRTKYNKGNKRLRALQRIGKNLPLTISHEETTEVRAKPGSQAIVQFQAQRRLPVGGTSGDAVGGLLADVNRTTGGVLGTYNGGITFDQIYRYGFSTSDARAPDFLNHRSDWTMFTNASWRDGASAYNGRYDTESKAKRGYVTPIDIGLIIDTDWWKRTEGQMMTNPIGTEITTPTTVMDLTDYHHLMESISVSATNNGVVPTKLTLWECVLAHDIPLSTTQTLAETLPGTATWGALPCPIQMWRLGRQHSDPSEGSIKLTEYGAAIQFTPTSIANIANNDGEGAVGTRMGAPSAAAGGGFSADGLQIKDIDAPGMKPRGQVLRHWYKLVPHTRVVAPGQSTNFNVTIHYNKRIPGMWWNTYAGIKGMTRTFFMTSEPYKMVGTTGVDEVGVSGPGSRLMVMGNTDLTMKWTKTKRFTRSSELPRRAIRYHATIPEIDNVAVRNPEDNDAEDQGDGALGGDEL